MLKENLKKKILKSKLGFTLIELMIAAMIMSMITLSMVKIFATAYDIFALTAQDVKVLMDAIFVFDELSSKIRMTVRPEWQYSGPSCTDTPFKNSFKVFDMCSGQTAYYGGTKWNFWNGNADYNNPVALADNRHTPNHGIQLALTTYRSNTDSADNAQKYGIFDGYYDQAGNTVEGRYVWSYKDRQLEDPGAGTFYHAWNRWDMNSISNAGIVATNIYGMEFYVANNIDLNSSTNTSGGNNHFVSGPAWVNTNVPAGVKIMLWLKRKTKSNGRIVNSVMPYYRFTSIRYNDPT